MSGVYEYPTPTQRRLDEHETDNNVFCDAPATFGVGAIDHDLTEDGAAPATPTVASTPTPAPSNTAETNTTNTRVQRMRPSSRQHPARATHDARSGVILLVPSAGVMGGSFR